MCVCVVVEGRGYGFEGGVLSRSRSNEVVEISKPRLKFENIPPGQAKSVCKQQHNVKMADKGKVFIYRYRYSSIFIARRSKSQSSLSWL